MPSLVRLLERFDERLDWPDDDPFDEPEPQPAWLTPERTTSLGDQPAT